MTTFLTKPKHFTDPWIQASADAAVWHNDPKFEEFMTQLIDVMRPSCFVETWTHMGWTSYWIAERYPWLPIYTTEIHERYIALARDNLAGFPQVCCKAGPSIPFLEKLVPMLARGGTPLFWLDAHWWPPVPLQDECRIVSGLDYYIAVIDDFECKDPDFKGDGGEATFGFQMCDHKYVAEFLGPKCWRPAYENTAYETNKGYGVFIKDAWTFSEDVNGMARYVPPAHLLKMDELK